MTDFNTSLLREKFIIRDLILEDSSNDVIALSNRLVVPMINPRGAIVETFVVRAQNMHVCVRLAAKLEQIFRQGGKIILKPDFDWLSVWEAVIDGYERVFNPDCWGAIYFEGKRVFQSGEYHAFLDIIEKFDAKQNDDYERALKIAEKAFQDAGKSVKIEHETNVALVVSINPKQARCGIILRSVGSKNTFNFTAKADEEKEIRIAACLSVAAAFLEGIQLAFMVGMGKRKVHHEILEDETQQKKIFEGEKRLKRLNMAITNFDNAHDVNYRPERPDLFRYLVNAEKFADKILKPQIKAKLEAGEYDEKDWVS